MKRTILFSILIIVCASHLHAQKNAAYAITASQKGQSNWAQVKLIDLSTGQEIKTIYKGDDAVEILNARTGKPVVKKDAVNNVTVTKKNYLGERTEKPEMVIRKYERDATGNMVSANDASRTITIEKRHVRFNENVQADKPFATNSAACAYDKKHDRLYYTPMGINQLRYIDLKDETPKIFYFEDETFGALSSRMDIPNQITRMVMGADGNGYALSNNADHLIRFTTKKKAAITDLGPLTDDAANAGFSIRSNNAYGGDMIADDKGNFYLITAAKNVFKIDLESKVATYKGTITGLPRGYSTNGAIVEKGTSVIVSSANSTEGYFKFDITSLAAGKIANDGSVFNASDLANSTLLSAKKIKEDKEPEVEKEAAVFANMAKAELTETENKVGIFPNPATAGSIVKVSFADIAKGKYTLQLMDISGKIINAKAINVSGKMQVENYQLPELLSKGSYIIKLLGEAGKVVSINKLVVQ